MSTPAAHVFSTDDFGNLFTAENGAILNDAAQQKYAKYLQTIDKLQQDVQTQTESPSNDNISPLELWEQGLRQLYKQFIFDAFKALHIPKPSALGDMEVYFTGSLGRAEATAYSDLDAFVIYKNDTIARQCQPVFTAINQLCNKIFDDRHQMFPDPVGINPARLSGTVDSILTMLRNPDMPVREEIAVSIYSSSKPILGQCELGNRLRQEIKEDADLSQFISANACYTKAIEEYGPPRENETEINIKRHILRPLDFILRGLREEFNLYNDSTVYSTNNILDALKDEINSDIRATIQRISEQSLALRFKQHNTAGREQDRIARTRQIAQLLADVAKLREFAAQRRQQLVIAANRAPQTTTAADIQTHHVDTVPRRQAGETTRPSFFARYSKALGMTAGVSAVVLGFVLVGLALMATGIFAPLGVGVAAIAITVGVYASGGLATCGVAYGAVKGAQAIQARKQQQLQASNHLPNQTISSHSGPLRALTPEEPSTDHTSPPQTTKRTPSTSSSDDDIVATVGIITPTTTDDTSTTIASQVQSDDTEEGTTASTKTFTNNL